MFLAVLILYMAMCISSYPSVDANGTEDLELLRTLSRIKSNFSIPIVNDLLEFPQFRLRFDRPYLDVTSAATYAREIARSAAHHPLFLNKKRVEELVLDRLLPTFLPPSDDYCSRVECFASRIGDVLTEVSVDRGLLTNRTSGTVMRLYAGFISGTILLRLSKLPSPKSNIALRLNTSSPPDVSWYKKLIQQLSIGLKNTTGFMDKEGGLDLKKSKALSSAISGSTYMAYNLSAAEYLSRTMVTSSSTLKSVLGSHLKETSQSLLVPVIVAENVVSCMMKQGLETVDRVEEVFGDVLKLVMLGITMDRMNLANYKNYIIYS